jgi:hypothetical protein
MRMSAYIENIRLSRIVEHGRAQRISVVLGTLVDQSVPVATTCAWISMALNHLFNCAVSALEWSESIGFFKDTSRVLVSSFFLGSSVVAVLNFEYSRS